MRLLALLASFALILSAGCVRDEPVAEAATDDPPADAPPETDPTTEPAPPTPSPTSRPASSPPPPETSTEPAPEPEPPAPAPRIEVLSWNGNITGAGAWTGGQAPTVCCPGANVAGEHTEAKFAVGTLQGIVVELVWDDATADLDLVVEAPDFDPTPPAPAGTDVKTATGHRWIAGSGGPAAPDGHATLVLSDAEALALTGEWTWRVVPKGPANAIVYRLHVSLFHDSVPADGYTAEPTTLK